MNTDPLPRIKRDAEALLRAEFIYRRCRAVHRRGCGCGLQVLNIAANAAKEPPQTKEKE